MRQTYNSDRSFDNDWEPPLLESRNDEQTATDRNQVVQQSNVEIWQAQGPYEPSTGLITGETTDDSAVRH